MFTDCFYVSAKKRSKLLAIQLNRVGFNSYFYPRSKFIRLIQYNFIFHGVN